ncbi:helix-turn-helix domain-containing protein [Streptomyces sp. SP18CS02]|uniref:helix-turn-helix domain-containing protein n=1 Tax=Streptomyces sp. SP18CS02 TaxID=3002531 RepID=UPI002E78FB0F|nr:helix-turn-helix transcriptional regulator [Streptomyces sp. SP18CS02]MEE1757122.1 helix-turn-helix transcriptional regulator [Streptomyces sp. SP18CS02]
MHPAPRSAPFDALAARRLREALGMAPGHVAYGLHAQYGLPVPPETVIAWERGHAVPGPRELTALAGVLWCSPAELLASAMTLREHRIARALAPDDLARRVGVDARTYLRMEESGRWRGNERQTAALAEALGLGPRELLTATGRDDELADLLRSAATTRWQAYVRPASKLVPMRRDHLEDVLQQLHTDYQTRMVATSSWGATGDSGGDSGRAYLERIVDHFWALARD